MNKMSSVSSNRRFGFSKYSSFPPPSISIPEVVVEVVVPVVEEVVAVVEEDVVVVVPATPQNSPVIAISSKEEKKAIARAEFLARFKK